MADGQAPDWATAPDWAKEPKPPAGVGALQDAEPPAAPAPPTFGGTIGSQLTRMPTAIYEAGKGALSDIWEHEKQRAAHPEAIQPGLSSALPTEALSDVASGALKTVSPALEPFEKAAETAAGPVTAGMTKGIQAVGEPIAKALSPDAKLPTYEEVYGKIHPEVMTALGLMLPTEASPGMGLSRPRITVRPPPPPAAPELGITLSKGQETGDLPLIQREQAALRNQAGPAAYERAQKFKEQQESQIEALRANAPSPLDSADTVAENLRTTALDQAATDAQRGQRLTAEHENIRSNLSNDGRVIAQTPQEAADIIGASVTRAEEQARVARDDAYAAFTSQPGTFEPRVFGNIGKDIRASLNSGTDPVVLNSKTTPMAIAAVRDMDQTIGAAARNAMDPAVKSFKPFTPASVDDVRKRLVAFQRQASASARASGDFSDVRAIGAVKDAFDDIVQRGLRNPKLFSGNGRAVADAMANARGMHADLRSTFSSQGPGDKVGPAMQQIIGRGTQSASSNQIAKWLYGTGEQPVQVARRMVDLFGEASPEVSALKQGLFSHITERPPGVTQWGPEQVADRIYDFVNGRGRELAREYFNPNEQARLRAYADRLRASVAPPPPRTDVVSRALDRINGVGGQGATSAELADTLFGRSGMGENPLGVKLAQHVRDTYGLDSEAFNAIRAGMVSKLTDGSPAAVAKKIDEHLFGHGRPMADTLYSPAERAMLQRYGEFMGKLQVPQAGANWSGTATPILAKISKAVGGVIGMIVGHHLLPGGYGLGEVTGAYLGSKMSSAVENAMNARKIAAQLPLVSEAMDRWQRAVTAATRANAPTASPVVTAAAANLQRALINLHPSLTFKNIMADISGPGTARANQQNQQNIPRGPAQQKDGGAVENKSAAPQLAHGGTVADASASKPKTRFHPQQIGARQAPDGHWYVKRAGRYLRVVPRGRSAA